MMDENELLFDELYEKTKDFGRTQFVRLLMAKERENKELKIKVSLREEVSNKYKEVIDKAIEWVKDWTHGANDWFEEDSKPSELLDILKEVE